MANDLFPVAGAKFYIGGPMDLPDADVTESTFNSVSWVRAKKWTTVGQFGDAAALITSSRVDTERDVKGKGTRNAGQMANVFALDLEDAGQLALIAAEKTSYNYPIKVEWNDAPSGGTPTIQYFIGLVTTAQFNAGGANTERTLNSTIEINTNIFTDPRAA